VQTYPSNEANIHLIQGSKHGMNVVETPIQDFFPFIINEKKASYSSGFMVLFYLL